MAQNFLKYYQIQDLDHLEDIRTWTQELQNRSQLVEEISGDQRRYMVLFQDEQAMNTSCPVFEAEFGKYVQVISPGE